MAEIMGMLAAGALKVAAGKMAEAAGDRIKLQWRFGEDLEDIEDTVESIQAVLVDAEGQSMVNASAGLWLRRLTRASNDISDIFDEHEVNKTRRSTSRKLKVLSPCFKLVHEFGMASKMKQVREKLEKISNHHHQFSFVSGNSSIVQPNINERVTSSHVVEANIRGRVEEKQKLMKLLTTPSTSREPIILPIYGIGGIGKTTLAQLLFNDTHFVDYKKAWVYVGQTFNLDKIEESIKQQVQLSNTEPRTDPSASVTKKNILIVLDDLWEKDGSELHNLKSYLINPENGHKLLVIITTRDADIANNIKTTHEAHKIAALSDDDCWDIIKQIVGFENRSNKDVLESKGKDIAKKCGGVALAARAIGYLLSSRDDKGWDFIKDSAIWNVSRPGYFSTTNDNDLLPSLKLSYSSMPPSFRLCFAYCAVFPKGHKMAKNELIYQWDALGFISPSEGEVCIKQLLSMSFFRQSESESSDGKHVTWFTMHDLVHDLARFIMRDEILDPSSKDFKYWGRNWRYAVLADCSKPLNSFVSYLEKLKALLLLGDDGKLNNFHTAISTAKYLRVLDLGEHRCLSKKLISSIGQLKLLRYLNAPGIENQEISCITKMSKLMYLNLNGSSISALPKSIGKLNDLKYIDLSRCSEITELPTSFGELKNLVHLDVSFCPYINNRPEALCSLTKLQCLDLSWERDACPREDAGLFEAIIKLTELRYLNLSGNIDFHFGYTNYCIPDYLRTLTNLEHLDLSWNCGLFTVPDSICRLRKLHTLNLSHCPNIERLPANMDRMDSLKVLMVNDCSRFDGSTIPINLIYLPHFMVRLVEGEQRSNLTLLKDVNPFELEISQLENVKSIEEAHIIEVKEKENLIKLTLGWTIGKKVCVEDMKLLRELLPPSSLEEFKLRGYNSLNFPAWIINIALYLPRLVRVTLEELPQCSSLPPLGQLANLTYLHLKAMPSIKKIDPSFCGDRVKAFDHLEKLIISDMENLEKWSTTYSCDEEGMTDEFMFPNLERLDIVNCPKLRMGPCPPKVKGTWLIEKSDEVVLQWKESLPRNVCHTCAPPALKLVVKECNWPMHRWKLLHHLLGLEVLTIVQCSDLSSSPEIPLPLGSVHTLHLRYCTSQTLPERLGDLVSLKNLLIQDCDIRSLPESTRLLTNLESLEADACPELHDWYNLEENKTKMGHIKQVRVPSLL